MATALPNRRQEAWKYSDLAAALPGVSVPESASGGVIERLAGGFSRIDVPVGAHRTIVERLEDGASATRATVAANAVLTRVVMQEASSGVPLSSWRVDLAEGAAFRQFVFMEGARLARVETDVTITGEGAGVVLDGVYLVAAGRHADLTSTVLHQCGGSSTRQLVKGAVRRGGRGVFQGNIVVARDAQGTEARQNHHALLLEAGAEAFAKPALEIHADDVVCAHGNTVGGLDADSLFYLRARGIPEALAQSMLIEAFVSEAVPAFLDDVSASEVRTRIAAWLENAS